MVTGVLNRIYSSGSAPHHLYVLNHISVLKGFQYGLHLYIRGISCTKFQAVMYKTSQNLLQSKSMQSFLNSLYTCFVSFSNKFQLADEMVVFGLASIKCVHT